MRFIATQRLREEDEGEERIGRQSRTADREERRGMQREQ
jgi:hypothetical protein